MAELRRLQAETSGLVRAMGDMLANRQSQFEKAFSERLDAVTHRIGQSMQSTHAADHRQSRAASTNVWRVIDSRSKILRPSPRR